MCPFREREEGLSGLHSDGRIRGLQGWEAVDCLPAFVSAKGEEMITSQTVEGCKGCKLGPHHDLHKPGFPPSPEDFAVRYVRTGGFHMSDLTSLTHDIIASHLGYGSAYNGDGYGTYRGKIAVFCHGEKIAEWTAERVAHAFFHSRANRATRQLSLFEGKR